MNSTYTKSFTKMNNSAKLSIRLEEAIYAPTYAEFYYDT